MGALRGDGPAPGLRGRTSTARVLGRRATGLGRGYYLRAAYRSARCAVRGSAKAADRAVRACRSDWTGIAPVSPVRDRVIARTRPLTLPRNPGPFSHHSGETWRCNIPNQNEGLEIRY